jgi:hypothetical protein
MLNINSCNPPHRFRLWQVLRILYHQVVVYCLLHVETNCNKLVHEESIVGMMLQAHKVVKSGYVVLECTLCIQGICSPGQREVSGLPCAPCSCKCNYSD